MTADSVFPPIGQLTYLLTFPPYGFLWFLLCPAPSVRHGTGRHPSRCPNSSTLVIRAGQAGPTPENVRLLESEVLPSYLSRSAAGSRRRTRSCTRVRLAALTTIAERPALLFTEIEADVGDHTERYVLPLAITWGDETTSAAVSATGAGPRAPRAAISAI